MYLDDLRKRVSERDAQLLEKKPAAAKPTGNYMDELRSSVASRDASLAGKTTKLREEYKSKPVSVSKGTNSAFTTNAFYGADPKTVDIGALDAEIEKNRKAREKALADYDASVNPNMQGVVDNRSWEEKYAERSAVTAPYEKDIAALRELRELANSVQYEAAGEKALSELDADTLKTLDKILAGVPQNTDVPMQGIADNRSWEDQYAESEAYMNVFRQAMRDKGYTDEETEQLLDYRQRQQNKALYDLAVQKATAEAESGFGGAVSASAKSVPQNLTGGIGYLSAAAQTAHNKLTGKDRPIDVYAPEFVASGAAKAARESVSRQLEENTKWETNLTGNVASFLYNTGMSMADSVASSVIGRVLAVPTAGITTDAAKKFASNAAGVVLGSSVATSALVEAKERGISDERALLTGLAFGAAEGFFEKHSIDRWFGNKAVKGLLRDRVKQTLKNTGAQVITEGSEELATSIADTIADGIINGNLSDLNTRIRAYIRDGYTEKEAREKVSSEWWNSLAQDFLAGAISGGVMGGVSTGINTLLESKDVNDVYGDSAQELVAETLELDPENKTAQKAQARLDEGKKLKPTVIRSLLLDNREYIDREEAANPTPEVTTDQAERVALARPEDMTEEEASYVVESAASEFGDAAGVFKSAYSPTQDPHQYVSAAKVAYAIGRSMGDKAMAYAMNSENTAGLETWQIEKLVTEGKQAIAKQVQTVSAVKGSGKLVMPNSIKSEMLTNKQQVQIRVLDALAKVTKYTVELYESTINESGEYVGANGSYSPEEGVIRIDINAGKLRVDDIAEYAMLRTMSHELTHSFKKNAPAEYQKLREAVLDIIAEDGKTLDDLVSYKKARSVKEMTDEQALDEVVADACEMLLRDSNAIQRLVNKDKSLAQRVFDWIKQFFADLAAAFEGVSAAHQEALIIEKHKAEVLALWDAAFEMSMSNLSTAKEASTDVAAVEDTTNFSFRSLAEAAGFKAMELEDGTKVFLRDGVVVKNVTAQDINNSPIGALINASIRNDGWKHGITEKEAQEQREMFAGFCNLAISTGDFNMAMQFAGSSVFTAMKANSDKQYRTTYDFPSICTKTQAVIDQMSTAMVSYGRGLTDKEILELYDKVHFNGLPVPCPECYVFSRWIGIGGLLDNIKKYQTKYGKMTPAEVAKAYDDISKKVEQRIAESGSDLSKGKAKGKLHSELQKKYNAAVERVQKAENQGGKPSKKDLDLIAEIEPMLTDIKAMTWIDKVYFTDPSHKTRREKWEVPDDVLFDLNKGGIFASEYKAAWAFRTTQGAGYGKAITPYAEAVLGEGILVNNNTTKTIKQKAAGVLNNPFLNQRGTLDAPTMKMLRTARSKQLAQAFLGGQRFQSTSDARYENASDYLLAMLELQAMGGMAQVYTKVDGAVPAFAAWGMAINQSLMPKDGGLVDGKIADTPVGGMRPSIAFANREKFDTAGTITIGVNDNHIRAMFREWNRDFIIPYHASGGKAATVAEMRRIQDGEVKTKESIHSTDYTRTQSDKILSHEVLRWMGKTDEEIDLIVDRRAARLALLTGKKADMDVVRGSAYLTELHRRVNEEWNGVKLTKDTVESHIFPNEFWDETVDYEHSAKIVTDYLAYCEELGFLHRFSGLVPHSGQLRPAKGYDENGNSVELTDLAYQYDENGNKTDVVEPFFWKVLTDRRMYGNDRQYLPQRRVKLDADPDTAANFAKVNDGRAYDKAKSAEMSAELRKRIEDAKLYSDRDVAPTFYSHMAKVAGGLKQEKLGAASVVSTLTNRGVSAEEIKWSGLDVWLEGKKSVTKAELQEFVEGSMLKVEEYMTVDYRDATYVDGESGKVYTYDEAFAYARLLAKESGFDPNEISVDYYEGYEDDTITFYAEDGVTEIFTAVRQYQDQQRWGKFKLEGGENYREVVFTLPTSTYSNVAMQTHWGYEAEGVLAHARVQDFVASGKKMLFVEELQSDWHNEGHKVGYADKNSADRLVGLERARETATIERDRLYQSILPDLAHFYREHGQLRSESLAELHLCVPLGTQTGQEILNAVNERFAYPEDLQRRLDRYFEKRQEEAELTDRIKKEKNAIPDAPFRDTYHEFVMKRLLRMAAEEGYDFIGWTPSKIQLERWNPSRKTNAQMGITGVKNPDAVAFEQAYRIEYDQDIPKFMAKYGKKWGAKVGKSTLDYGESVWSMPITAAMRESVLYEGQRMFSDRGFGIPSNRALLVNYRARERDGKGVLESVERYKAKAAELREAERDLRDLRKQLEATPETDKAQLARLSDFIAKTKNRITAITAEMNGIESGKAMQALLSREKNTIISVVRAESAKRVAEYREKRNATETRKKLRDRITYRVKTLDKMLRKPTDDKHIPDGLQKTIFDFCELFTEEKGVWYGKQFAGVKARYEELKPKAAAEFSEFSVMDLYDESIPEMLQYLEDHLVGRRLAELTKSELEMVLAIADHFAFMVKNENEIFFGNRKANLAETVQNLFAEAADNSVTEYIVGSDAKSFRKGRDFITTNNLKPIYFFRNKGNTLKTLFNDMLTAQKDYALKMATAKAFVEKTKKDLGYDEWFDPDAKLVMTTDAGQRVELTIQQAMSLVATYEREVRSGESYHTTQGGFIYAGEVLGTAKTKGGKNIPLVKKVNAEETYEAHPMSVTDMAKVIGWLREISPNTISYVETMVRYLSSDLADIGNDVSKKLFGYKKFWDEFYFPIKSSSDFLKSEPGQIGKDDSRWKHKGFTKSRIPNANNAFVLDDFDSVWKKHTSEMLMFATMAIPQDSFVRVLNAKTAVDKEGLAPSRSTKNVIKTAYGDSALQYIDTLLNDVNGGVSVDPREGAYGKWLSIFKKGATALSASVAIQQPSAMVRALMHIDLKYLRKGMANPDFDEALAHSGLAVLKTIGGYDTTTGRAGADWLMAQTPDGIVNKAKAAMTFGKNDTGYRDELLYLLPQKMDELSWGILWSAAKAEVEDTTTLEKGSDAYWDAVTDRFDEIIELTQVYDSVLTRSANMRAKSLAMKAVTAFGAEPTTTLNIAAAALQDFVAKKPNAKKNLAKATAVLFASVVVNSMLKAIVTAPRDDDESKTLPEKYIEKVIGGIVNDVNPMSYFPLLRDIVSLFEGFTAEDKFIAPIGDLIEAMQKAADERSWENILNASLQVPTLFGVPLENLWRDIKGVYNAFFKTAHLRESSWEGAADAAKAGLGFDDPTVKDSILEALKQDGKGNERKRKNALDEIVGIYNDKVKQYRLEGVDASEADKKAKTAIRSQITQALKPLYQAASTTAEKNKIIALARRVYVGGEQLYKDYDFNRYWSGE